MANERFVRDTVEYVKFTLADRDGENLSGDTVSLALVADGSSVDTATWLGCTFVSGTTWRTTSPLTLTAANYPASTYQVYAKVVDSPETPYARLGVLGIAG